MYIILKLLIILSCLLYPCILSLLFKKPEIDLQCKDINNNPVDWFVAYKLPLLDNHPKHKNGLDFLYSDSNIKSWIISPKNINDSKSAIGYTLSQLWKIKNKTEYFYALYNDEHPKSNNSDSYRGHMKGVLAFDDLTGLWMIHSVPKFIDINASSYSYTETGTRNGQSFLCVTFSNSELKNIGTQLMISQPSIYASNLPTSYAKLFPDLAKAIGMRRYSSEVYSSIKSLKSLKNVEFTSFSKNRKYNKDIYQDLIAPELKTSLYVETWLNGGGDLLSYCNSSYKIYNLRSVIVDTDFAFTNSKDHSKWAVSSEQTQPYVCIGDINRQKSQMGRGGGSLCFKSEPLWYLYRTSVDHVECCPTNRFHLPSFDYKRINNGSNTQNFSFIFGTFIGIFIGRRLRI